MLIRDREQIEYIRSAMVRDVTVATRQIEQIHRGDILLNGLDGENVLAQLKKRIKLALEIDKQIAKDLGEPPVLSD